MTVVLCVPTTFSPRVSLRVLWPVEVASWVILEAPARASHGAPWRGAATATFEVRCVRTGAPLLGLDSIRFGQSSFARFRGLVHSVRVDETLLWSRVPCATCVVYAATAITVFEPCNAHVDLVVYSMFWPTPSLRQFHHGLAVALWLAIDYKARQRRI